MSIFFPDIDCGKPVISDGCFLYTTTTFGSRANVQCNEGYIIDGNSLYTCKIGSIWVGFGTCSKFYCYGIV